MRTCHYLKWTDVVNVMRCVNKSVVVRSDWLYVQQFLFITRFQLGDNATTIFQQSQWHSSKAIIITHNTIISLLTSSCLRIIGYCGSTSLGFGSVLCSGASRTHFDWGVCHWIARIWYFYKIARICYFWIFFL